MLSRARRETDAGGELAGGRQGGERQTRGVREPEHRRQQIDGAAAATGAPQHDVQMPGEQYATNTAAGEDGDPRRLS